MNLQERRSTNCSNCLPEAMSKCATRISMSKSTIKLSSTSTFSTSSGCSTSALCPKISGRSKRITEMIKRWLETETTTIKFLCPIRPDTVIRLGFPDIEIWKATSRSGRGQVRQGQSATTAWISRWSHRRGIIVGERPTGNSYKITNFRIVLDFSLHLTASLNTINFPTYRFDKIA